MTTDDVTQRKSLLRRQMRETVVANRGPVDSSLSAALLSRGVTTVAGFIPLPDELDVLPLLRRLQHAGITVLVPRVVGANLEFAEFVEAELTEGHFGVLEPTTAQTWELAQCEAILIPAVACDVSGGRLGRGRGFYDRALAQLSDRIWRVGVVADEHVLRAHEIPMASHDVRMHAIATQSQLVHCKAD